MTNRKTDVLLDETYDSAVLAPAEYDKPFRVRRADKFVAAEKLVVDILPTATLRIRSIYDPQRRILGKVERKIPAAVLEIHLVHRATDTPEIFVGMGGKLGARIAVVDFYHALVRMTPKEPSIFSLGGFVEDVDGEICTMVGSAGHSDGWNLYVWGLGRCDRMVQESYFVRRKIGEDGRSQNF